jgi:hypothetical protein
MGAAGSARGERQRAGYTTCGLGCSRCVAPAVVAVQACGQPPSFSLSWMTCRTLPSLLA